MHKKRLIIGFITLLIVLICCLLLLKKDKKFQLDEIKKSFLVNYQDIHVLDEYDISMYFGINNPEISSLFMSDFVSNEDNAGIFDPNKLFIVINSKNIDSYYEILLGYLNSNENNNEKTEKYDKAILKKIDNSLYLILGENNDKMEEELLAFYY